jgi:hypothetical protein
MISPQAGRTDHVGLHQEHNHRLANLEQLTPVVVFSSRQLLSLQDRLEALERLQALEGWWLTKFVFWCRTTWRRIAGLFS